MIIIFKIPQTHTFSKKKFNTGIFLIDNKLLLSNALINETMGALTRK